MHPGTKTIYTYRPALLAAIVIAGGFATAQSASADPVKVKLQGSQLVLSPAQKLMLEASNSVLTRDFSQALKQYNEVITLDPSNVQAYIQRSVVQREMGNEKGSQADATMAVRIAEAALQQEPQNAKLYHQRGMGYRLLRDFPKAKENIRHAIQLSNNKRDSWMQDLQAIELEEKIY